MTVVIDPYFHYHAPLKQMAYPLTNQRYQNDGISRHFDYNAVITGSSMTENFKTSEFDKLFGVNSIKISYSGAFYKEINESLVRAVDRNSDIKLILRCLDSSLFFMDKDAVRYDLVDFPTYLYDDSLQNDVNYIFNKSVLEQVYDIIVYTKQGGVTTSFDNYSNWMNGKIFGKDALDAVYTRPSKVNTLDEMSDSDFITLKDSITQNVILLVEATPNIDYYLFFPPYSIYYWDSLNQTGELKKQLAAENAIIKLLIKYDNIHLYSFNDEFDLICNLDNYKDTMHYGEWINSQMLLWMENGEHRLTKDNYQAYCDRVYKFYTEYDYDNLFE